MPDGGKNIWSNTLDNNGDPNNPMDWLPRQNSKRTDFFTDDVIQGRISDRMTDATRPSTKTKGYSEHVGWDWETIPPTPIIEEFPAEKTHIGIVDFKKQNDGINDYMTVKVYYNYWEGTVEENSTMSGTVIIGDDLTIASGVTLTIQAGTEVTFEEDSKLIVNGELIVNGTSANQVIFTSSEPAPSLSDWQGIEVNGSNASATLSYCTVEYASKGINFSNGASGSVSNSTFQNNYYGIYTNYADPIVDNCNMTNNKYGLYVRYSYTTPSWMSVDISNCDILNNTTYGLYLYNSSPTLSDNRISGNARGAVLYYSSNPIIEQSTFTNSTYYGLACYGSASPKLHYNSGYSFGGYNTITSNGSKGIRVTGSSNPNFGNFQFSLAGFNSIYNNTGYELENTTSNTIEAQNNWWGSASGWQTGDLYGSVNASICLPTDPNGGQQSKTITGTPEYEYDKDSGLPEVLQQASFKQSIAEFSTSAEMYKQHFTQNRNSAFNSVASIGYLNSLGYYLEPKEIVDEIEKTLKQNLSTDAIIELKSSLSVNLCLTQNPNTAITKLDEALKLKITEEDQNRILSQKALILIYELNETEKGKSILEEIVKNTKSESPWNELAKTELKILNGKNSILPKQNVVSSVEEVPNEYELVGNYPNPFNPSTKIKYALPFTSEVKLSIYDIMGREVRAFELNSQSAGSHELEWNGTNNNGSLVSSGIYLLHFNATSVENNKSFNKTVKLMLVK